MYLDGQINVSGARIIGTFLDNERGYEFNAAIDGMLGEWGRSARLTFDNPTQLAGDYACTGTMAFEGINLKLINNKQETLTLTTPGQEQVQGATISGNLNWTD